MTFLKSAPVLALSAILAATTSLYSLAEAGCSSCGNNSTEQTAPRKTKTIKKSPARRITRREIFPSYIQSNEPVGNEMRNSAYGPIFGSDDCSLNEGPMFGDNTCTRRKCGGAMFGPQTCKKIELPCEDCQKDTEVLTANAPAIRNIKEIPVLMPDPVYKCSDLAPIQLEWVDFRIQRGRTLSYSRDLGNYRFRLFGCRRNSKKAMLNEGRIIQKNMKFIEIFEDTVRDCYSIVKLPPDICLQNSPYNAPEYILTAEISDYFMNVCDGYDWNEAKNENLRTGSAEMTVVWRLMDLSKSKILWKGETTGYSELQNGAENGEMVLIEEAFAEAARNLKGMPEFEAQLAIRVSPDEIERQKNVLLNQERIEDPVKCKFEPQIATKLTCPVSDEVLTDNGTAQSSGGSTGNGYQQTAAALCPAGTEPLTDGNSVQNSGGSRGDGYQNQQCRISAEMLEFEAPETKTFQCTNAYGTESLYTPQGTALCPVEHDLIPLELEAADIIPPYTTNGGTICYGYNNTSNVYEFNPYTISNETQQIQEKPVRKMCEPEIVNYFNLTEDNICENPLFAENNEACDPSLAVFLKAEGECSYPAAEMFDVQEVTEANVSQPQMCLFAEDEVTSVGGISKDEGYFIPEVETVEVISDKTAEEGAAVPTSWQPYEDGNEFVINSEETTEDIPSLEGVPVEKVTIVDEISVKTSTEETDSDNISLSGGFRENGFIYIRNDDGTIEKVTLLEETSGDVSQSGGIREDGFVYIQHDNGTIEKVQLEAENKAGTISQSGGIRDSGFIYIQHENGTIEEVELLAETDGNIITQSSGFREDGFVMIKHKDGTTEDIELIAETTGDNITQSSGFHDDGFVTIKRQDGTTEQVELIVKSTGNDITQSSGFREDGFITIKYQDGTTEEVELIVKSTGNNITQNSGFRESGFITIKHKDGTIEQVRLAEEKTDNDVTENSGFREDGFITIRREGGTIEQVQVVQDNNTEQNASADKTGIVTIKHQDGTTEQVRLIEESSETNLHSEGYFCIENKAPYKEMNPENMYKVRASVMSVSNGNGKRAAGLLIAKDLILVSADIIDEKTPVYEIETINGVKAQANVHRINLQKNLALLQSTTELYFMPLSLNMELPPVGKDGYISIGWLNNAEGENYLDDKGTIQGYRYSENKGTEIIVNTFVQAVSSGSALIDDKGTVNGFASAIKKYDNSSDLYVPILDAINSVGLEVCGQPEAMAKIPTAVLKPVSTAIDSNTASKTPEVLAKKKRK